MTVATKKPNDYSDFQDVLKRITALEASISGTRNLTGTTDKICFGCEVNVRDPKWGPSAISTQGAIGDGGSHPLLNFFNDLAQAKAVYPFATSLSQELDWAAAQKATLYAHDQGGGCVYHPRGSYLWNTSLQMVLMSSIWHRGDGKGATTIKCTAALDGSDSLTQNNLFNVNNLQHVVIATTSGFDTITVDQAAPPGVMNKSIVFAAGIPSGAVILSGLGTTTWKLSAAATATATGIVSAVAVGIPGSYQRNLRWSSMTLDCTAQNPSGIPPAIRAGNNLCIIECQNVDGAEFDDLELIGGYGNAIVAPTIDPRKSAACIGPSIRHCVFRSCVRGLLPQYGVAGSVIQIGAATGGVISFNEFYDSGGPWIDYFNCVGLHVTDNLIMRGSTTKVGPGQCQAIEHADFGNEHCVSARNISIDAGPLVQSGIMVPNAFNIISTPGPQGCQFIDGVMLRTWMYPMPMPPALPASGFITQPPPGTPLALRVNGGTGFGLYVNNVVQPGSGPDGNQYAIPGHVIVADVVEGNASISVVTVNPLAVILNGNTISGLGFLGGTTIMSGAGTSTWTLGAPSTWTGRVSLSVVANVKPTYTTAPTSWEWFVAPALLFAPITLVGGSYPGQPLGLARKNKISGWLIVDPPSDGIYYSDVVETIEHDNLIVNPGNWNYPSSAFYESDSGAVAGTGCRDNTFSGGSIYDDHVNKTLFTNYRNDSANCVGARIINKRLEATVNHFAAGGGGNPYVNTGDPPLLRGCVGPGVPAGFLTPPTVPASGTALRNPFPYDVTVYVTGAAVTNVSVDGHSVATPGAVPVTVRLRAGESSSLSIAGSTYSIDTADTITLTYTGAVSWTWMVA